MDIPRNSQSLQEAQEASELAHYKIRGMIVTMGPYDSAKKMFPLPAFLEAVEQAVSAENLKAAASRTSDFEVLLGLAFLAQAGNPVRRELSGFVVKAKPEYAPIVAVLAATMDGVDEKSAGELVKSDPENALGHYLRANLVHESEGGDAALEAFRQAAACSELRLYESTTGAALFRALDALNVKGRDRLCALSWMASRSSNFSSSALQPLQRSLSELARSAPIEIRKEISDLLLILAGHLFSTNFCNRWFAQRAIESAFQLKAEVGTAEESPMTNGYAAVLQALVSTWLTWPGFEHRTKPEELARFLPSRIYRAFAVADPSKMTAANLGEMNLNLPESDKLAFEKAKENATKTARALIEVALTDLDGTLGAYLKGLPQRAECADRPWANIHTPVEVFLAKSPELLAAAAANEQAMNELWRAGDNDPRRCNVHNMMNVGWGIISYASSHNQLYPDNLDMLFEQGCLKSPLEAKSLLTGRPYVYIAAGEKQPAKSSDAQQFVLLYDDEPCDGRYYECVTAIGVGTGIGADQLREQLRKRGKEKSEV